MKKILSICIVCLSQTSFASPVIVTGVTENTEDSFKMNVSNDVLFVESTVLTISDYSYSSPFVMSTADFHFESFSYFDFLVPALTSRLFDVSARNKGDPNN
jgi:hypothetical protein